MNFQGKNVLLEFLFSFSRNKLILEKKIKERFFSGKKTPQHFVYISFIFKRKKTCHKTLFFPLEKNHGENSFLQRKVNLFLEAACVKKLQKRNQVNFLFRDFFSGNKHIFAEYKKKIGPSELPYKRSPPAPYTKLK